MYVYYLCMYVCYVCMLCMYVCVYVCMLFYMYIHVIFFSFFHVCNLIEITTENDIYLSRSESITRDRRFRRDEDEVSFI